VADAKPKGYTLNLRALDRALGRLALYPEHAALVTATRNVAAVIDDQARAGRFDAQAWREYRLLLKSLTEIGAGRDDPLAVEVEELRAAAVRDASNP